MRRDAQIEREEFPEHAGIEYFDCKKNLKSKQGLPIFCLYKRKESPSPLVPYATGAPFPNSKPLSSRFDDRGRLLCGSDLEIQPDAQYEQPYKCEGKDNEGEGGEQSESN
jgi:hypothetical protein